MFLLQLQLYVLTIIRVILRIMHKPLGESPHFVSLKIIPFLVKGTKKVSFISFRGTQRQFSENICSEDDLKSRIFGTFVVKFLACLPLLGFSKI